MIRIAQELRRPLVELLLSIADDKFMLGHRNSDWTGLAPILEEDIAFSSLAQDDIAHAAAIYEVVAEISNDSADRVAYGRQPEEYRCCALVELEDEFDWAVAITRQFLCDHFEMLRLSRIAASNDPELAALGRRLLAEERLSLGHADSWVVRLGQGNQDSHRRMQAALDRLAPVAVSLFEPPAGVEQLEQSGVYPRAEGAMFEVWHGAVQTVVRGGNLHIDLKPWPAGTRGGRSGVHSAAFAPLLVELTEVYREEPEARW